MLASFYLNMRRYQKVTVLALPTAVSIPPTLCVWSDSRPSVLVATINLFVVFFAGYFSKQHTTEKLILSPKLFWCVYNL